MEEEELYVQPTRTPLKSFEETFKLYQMLMQNSSKIFSWVSQMKMGIS